jgi:lipopolysaccharide transport system permease protein
MIESSEVYDFTLISARRRWVDWRLRQLWRCRDLQYSQTILGTAWHLLRPLLTTLTYTVVFSKVAGLPTDGAPGERA